MTKRNNSTLRKTLSLLLALALLSGVLLQMSLPARASDEFTPHAPADKTLEYGVTRTQLVGETYIDNIALQDGHSYVDLVFDFPILKNANGDELQYTIRESVYNKPGEFANSWNGGSMKAPTYGGQTIYDAHGGTSYPCSMWAITITGTAWNAAAPGTYTAEWTFKFGDEITEDFITLTTTIKVVVPMKGTSYTPHIPEDLTLEYGNTNTVTLGNIYVDDVQLQGTQNQIWCFVHRKTNLVNSNGDTIELRYSSLQFEMPIEEDKHALVYDNSSIGSCALYSNGGSTYITAYVKVANINAWKNAAPGKYTATVELEFQVYGQDKPVDGTQKTKSFTITAIVPDPDAKCGDNLYWTFDEATGALTITGTGKMWDWDPNQGNSPPWEAVSGMEKKIKTVTIADGVTSIGANAFFLCENMTDVTIPDSVTEIRDAAFRYCHALTSVTIPEAVTAIGETAFFDCELLRSVTIPAKVKSIGAEAFGICYNMAEILVDEANPYYSSLDGILYNKDQTVLIQYPAGMRAFFDVTIPDTVQRIEDKAFWYTHVEGVIIPEGVTKVVFTGCSELYSVYLPSTIEEIDADMFRECERLQYVTIKSRNCVIADDVGTLNDPSSTRITGYSGSTAEAYAKKYGYAFEAFAEETGKCGEGLSWSYDDGTNELIITGTGKMDDYPSYNDVPWAKYRNSVVKLTIADGVTSIGDRAFYYCTKLPDVTIPDSVTSIGEEAFHHCEQLTGVTIPKNVQSIGPGAFGGCTALTEILVDDENPAYIDRDSALLSKDQTRLIACPAGKETYEIPASVKDIESRAFDWCKKLKVLTIPKGVTSIADDAFLDCSNMEMYRVDGANPNYSGQDGVLFNKDKTRLIQFPAPREGTYDVPDSVKSINRYAFRRCRLEGVTIPEGVPEISFYDCSALKEVTIPSSVKSLGEGAFYRCYGLGNMRIPATVESIGKEVFAMAGFSTITILNRDCEIFDAEGTFGNARIIGYAGSTAEAYANKYGYKFQELVTGPGKCGDDLTWELDMDTGELTISGTGDMWDWDPTYSPWFPLADSVKKVTVRDGVTGIGKNAFYCCNSLTDISIADSVNRIGEQAFWSCKRLTGIKIPEGVTEIFTYTFQYCGNLKSLTLPESLTAIGYYAFEDCESLTKLTIPKNVTDIGYGTFSGCRSLSSVTLPEGLKVTDYFCFSGCSQLSSITIPASVTEIGDHMFYGCDALTSVTILSKDCCIGDSPYSLGWSSVTTIRGYKGSTAEGYAKKNGYNFVDIEADPCKSGHDFGKWVQEQDPTCTEPGRQTRTCTRCGQLALREVAPMGHDYKDGACIRCGALDPNYVPVTVNPALKVSFREVSPEEGTCVPGSAFRISFDVTNTGDTDLELEDFAWKNHKGVIANTTITKTLLKPGESLSGKGTEALLVIDPIAKEDADPGTQTAEMYGLIKITCEAKGYQPGTGTVLCTGSATKETALLKEGHVHEWESDFTVDTEPTCTEAGSKSIHCRTCSAKKDVTAIPALGHDYKDGFCVRCGEKDPAVGPAPDKTALNEAVAAAEALQEADYTPESFAKVSEALAAAKALPADATQTAIDQAARALNDAIAALVEKDAPPIEPPFRFDDVQDEGKFYFEPVYWAYGADPQITNGLTPTTFGPDAGCTRGQVVTFLWRAAGCPEPTSTETAFTDVSPTAFYAKAVAWAVEKGITNGMSPTSFAPGATCTRGQIVTFLWRFRSTPEPASAETPFTDVSPTAFYAKAVAWAVENKVTNGMTATTFGPDATCTRGQIVTFLYRAV